LLERRAVGQQDTPTSLYRWQGKKSPERRSGLHPSEKELPERRSGAFRHKNTPGVANISMTGYFVGVISKSTTRNIYVNINININFYI
jgi:hypothetical protein